MMADNFTRCSLCCCFGFFFPGFVSNNHRAANHRMRCAAIWWQRLKIAANGALQATKVNRKHYLQKQASVGPVELLFVNQRM